MITLAIGVMVVFVITAMLFLAILVLNARVAKIEKAQQDGKDSPT